MKCINLFLIEYGGGFIINGILPYVLTISDNFPEYLNLFEFPDVRLDRESIALRKDFAPGRKHFGPFT